MDAENADVAAVAAAIHRYLQDHPNAADTVGGIASWWLSENAANERLSHVQRAVELLVNRGQMVRTTLRDGTVIYERDKRHSRSTGRGH